LEEGATTIYEGIGTGKGVEGDSGGVGGVMEGSPVTTRLLLSVVLATLAVNAQAGKSEQPTEQYLCIADQSIGFEYNKIAKQWGGARFEAGSKYVISKSKDPNAAFQITEGGVSSPIGLCGQGFDDAGYLVCNIVFGTFTFHKSNGRFIRSNPFGYAEVGPDSIVKSDEETDTPYMEIGKCSPF